MTHGCSRDRFDRLFGVLDDPTRREVLYRLYAECWPEATALPIPRLVTAELDCRDTALYHVHLPKLVEAGYVEWPDSTGTVRPGERFDEVASLLAALEEHRDELSDEWPRAADFDPS